ncbi:MAG: long-chain fatty acid--CoA ligase [Anaerolineales bacterium]|nr:MAG: long-chain fatty acid--CoA ligase [Anaerolineales bacterium]
MKERPWFKHYESEVPKSIEYPEVPLYHFIENAAAKYPDQACAIFKGSVITYAEMDEIINRLAGSLAALGVKKGTPVGIFMPNSPQFVMAFYAILKAGGLVVATNPLYTAREIEHQMKDSGTEIMLVMSNFYSTIKEVQPKTPLKTLIVTNIKEYLPGMLRFLFTLTKEKKDGHRVELGEGDYWLQDLLKEYSAADRPQIEMKPKDDALYQYSGGTTGLSKAAIATHGNLVANTLQIKSWLPSVNEGAETVLMAIPMFHVYGMVAGMSFGVAAAASLVMVPNPRDMGDVLGSISKYRPTIYPGVPAMYNAINNHPDVKAGKVDVSSIKACISGSAPLMRETQATFEELTGGKLVEGYGLSEAPTATHCNPVFGMSKEGSIGIPFPDVDARIISLDDEVTVLETGEIGELVLKGPQVMKGYLNMPTETTNAIRDGWLYTGDIAYMDEDGYFFIVDRKKELIKPSGYQVWPREVEEVIAENPKVLEVGVAGIPDAYRGETVKAWVVLKPGETLTADEVKAWCKEHMAAFKVPTHVEFRDDLPKTTIGKVLRRELVRQDREKAGTED